MKKILAILKMIGLILAGVLAVIGVWSLTNNVQVIIKNLWILYRILIWVGLIVIALAVWCQWYLRNEPKK
jgi:hypothetical protein